MSEPTESEIHEFDIAFKIIILQLLFSSGHTLTNEQVTEFFLKNEIADFFTVQDALGALIETGNIDVIPSANRIFYRINAKGCETLPLFADRISPDLREKVLAYLEEHGIAIREDNSLIADYYPGNSGYVCHLRKLEGSTALLDLLFHIPDKAQAEAICTNWKSKADEVYDSLMDILVS